MPAQAPVDFSHLEVDVAALQQRQADLLNRDLHPYHQDDAFLVKRIGGPNRLLRHAPELRPQIKEALLADDDDSLLQLVDDLDLARQLYSPEREKPVNQILSFMNLLENINTMRAELHAEAHVVPRLNSLFELSYRKFAYSFPEDQLDDAQLTADYLIYRAQQLYNRFAGYQAGEIPIAQTAIDNLRIRLGGTFEAISACRNGYKYADGLPADSGESVTPEQAEQDTEYIGRLFAAMRASQRYGVKMAYTGEPELGGALIFSAPLLAQDFSDNEAMQGAYHPLLDRSDAVAHIIHTERRHHRRIKPTLTKTQGYSAVAMDVGTAISLSLGPDGELYIWRDCMVKLRDIALQKGRYQAYRALQATVLAHYYDLTHPLDEVARTIKALREQPAQIDPATRPALESIERLVVPRIKQYRGEVDPTQPAGAEKTDQEHAPRLLRRHGVIWHVRRLPEGWRPSPAALELADQLGVELAENETVVREHKRGSLSLGQVTAHHMVNRPQP